MDKQEPFLFVTYPKVTKLVDEICHTLEEGGKVDDVLETLGALHDLTKNYIDKAETENRSDYGFHPEALERLEATQDLFTRHSKALSKDLAINNIRGWLRYAINH
ncbi:hypothetical protein [Terasakiella sp. SH-1]|uniref:hypothetical protein n=1 Tax=Terasakiella sp. SH-1 TaxID=2560057 RepID=UPI00107412E6|nr:hypothetical protein [Terasakiella sp. SH-1]